MECLDRGTERPWRDGQREKEGQTHRHGQKSPIGDPTVESGFIEILRNEMGGLGKAARGQPDKVTQETGALRLHSNSKATDLKPNF